MLNYQGLNLTDIVSKSPRYPTLFCNDKEIQVLVGMEIYVSNWKVSLSSFPYMIHCNQNSRIFKIILIENAKLTKHNKEE